jgi:hypothetical protein
MAPAAREQDGSGCGRKNARKRQAGERPEVAKTHAQKG